MLADAPEPAGQPAPGQPQPGQSQTRSVADWSVAAQPAARWPARRRRRRPRPERRPRRRGRAVSAPATRRVRVRAPAPALTRSRRRVPTGRALALRRSLAPRRSGRTGARGWLRAGHLPPRQRRPRPQARAQAGAVGRLRRHAHALALARGKRACAQHGRHEARRLLGADDAARARRRALRLRRDAEPQRARGAAVDHRDQRPCHAPSHAALPARVHVEADPLDRGRDHGRDRGRSMGATGGA